MTMTADEIKDAINDWEVALDSWRQGSASIDEAIKLRQLFGPAIDALQARAEAAERERDEANVAIKMVIDDHRSAALDRDELATMCGELRKQIADLRPLAETGALVNAMPDGAALIKDMSGFSAKSGYIGQGAIWHDADNPTDAMRAAGIGAPKPVEETNDESKP